jgi:beta-galactosidase
VVQTTGEPYRIVVKPTKNNLLTDGKDAVVFNVTVVDKQGMEVPDAANLLHFSVTGDAHIIGVGNGDPSSHEADKYSAGEWQRRLFGGKCQIIVLSDGNGQPGTGGVVFRAEGEGLQAGTAMVHGAL